MNEVQERDPQALRDRFRSPGRSRANAPGGSAVGIRVVTDEECAFYDKHGWVKLPSLIDAEGAARMHAEAERFAAEEEPLPLAPHMNAAMQSWEVLTVNEPIDHPLFPIIGRAPGPQGHGLPLRAPEIAEPPLD